METEKFAPAQPAGREQIMPSGKGVSNGSGHGQPRPGFRRLLNWRTGLILVVAAAAVTAFAVWKHEARSPEPAAAMPIVPVARVTREDLFNEVNIPAEFRAYVEVELHAKVSGYVDQMLVDFGDVVKSNQLLATLEVPELLDQLHNAMAMQQRAEADYTNTMLIYNRLEEVNRQDATLVAQQDVDSALAKRNAAAAAISAARADVEKYRTLTNYTRIVAPFDGVVTYRYADPGALIQAGTSSDTQSLPLVRVSDNYHLRLDFMISVAYVKDIRVGGSVDVIVDSLGGRRFSGTITRTTERVNKDTRTMVVEIEVPNPNLEIVPGMYASVDLKVEQRPKVLAVPIGALGGEDNSSVYVVNSSNVIEDRQVKTGLETPYKKEITSGLKEGEMVLVAKRAFFRPGQKVEPSVVDIGVVK